MMGISRRAALSLPLGLVFGAHAADAPGGTVRLVVGFAPGGGTDGAARIVAEKLAAELGQPVLVENRAGAGGTIAAQSVARAPADGQTLLFGTGAELVINPVTRKAAPYDVLRDFVPVAEVGGVSFVLVVPAGSAADSVAGLVALAKAKPSRLNFSSFGTGSTNHLLGELFVASTGIKVTHVPYQGSAQAMTALLAGDVDFAFETAAVALPQLKAGKLRALATPSPRRMKELPATPTLQEAGYPELVAEGWMGVFAPAATPAPVVQRLSAALAKVLQMPDVAARLSERGVLLASPSAPEAFRRRLATELEKWRRVAKESGVSLE